MLECAVKKKRLANLQDLLIYTLKGISVSAEAAENINLTEIGRFIIDALFATITNANFDSHRIETLIKQGLKVRDSIKVNNSGLA